MNGTRIFGLVHIASCVVFGIEIFRRKDGEFTIINIRLAIKFKAVYFFGINRWTVDGLHEGFVGNVLRQKIFVATKNKFEPRRVFFRAKAGSSKPIFGLPAGKTVVLQKVVERLEELNVSVKIETTLSIDGIHANDV